jgi:hypothetical protein
MTEAEYRARLTGVKTIEMIGDGRRHQLGRIVNPARLIESLGHVR